VRTGADSQTGTLQPGAHYGSHAERHADREVSVNRWNLVRSSQLALSCEDARFSLCRPRFKRAASTGLSGGLPGSATAGPVAAALVGDGEGEVFQLGDQLAQAAVVADPLPVVVDLVVGDQAADGLAGPLAGPVPVRAVQLRRVGVAAAAGPAAAHAPLGEGAGQRQAQAGEFGGDARGAVLGAGRHVLNRRTRGA